MSRMPQPPGGKSSLGTGFGWADDTPSVARSGRAQVNGSNASRESSDSMLPSPNRPAPPSNSASYPGNPPRTGASFGSVHEIPPQTAGTLELRVGAMVMYAIKPGVPEERALVVDVGNDGNSAQGRRDNIRIQFEDGRERQTSEGRLRVVAPAPSAAAAPVPYGAAAGGYGYGAQPGYGGDAGYGGEGGYGMHESGPDPAYMEQPYASSSAISQSPYATAYPPTNYASPPQAQRQTPQQQQGGNILSSPAQDSPSRGFGDTGRSSVRIFEQPGGRASMGSGFGWGMEQASPSKKGDFVENRIGSGIQVVPLKNGSTGELGLGQVVLYKQTPRSDEVKVTVVDIELPSTNGAMRTKTYYTIRFEDGRERQTTIDKIIVPRGPIG